MIRKRATNRSDGNNRKPELLATRGYVSSSLPSKSGANAASPPKMAIIGASYGGLTLANLLHKNHIPFVILESKIPPFPFVSGGEFNVPSLPQIMKKLELKVPKEENQEDELSSSPSRKAVINTLLKHVKDNIMYGQKVCKIVNVRQNDNVNLFYIHHIQRFDDQAHKSTKESYGMKEDVQISGPYTSIIGADGVKSICRKLSLPGTYLIGDARWVDDRFYDFGYRRINQGANIAMSDAIELGTMLVDDCPIIHKAAENDDDDNCRSKSQTFHGGRNFKDKYGACGISQKSRRRREFTLFLLLLFTVCIYQFHKSEL